MNVLSIGSDRAVFEEGSETRTRAEAYAARLGELHIVVFSLIRHGLKEVHAGPLHVYPTNSYAKLFYMGDARRLARRLRSDVVTVQDPFEAGLVGFWARKRRPLHVQVHTDPFAPGFGTTLLNRIRQLVAGVVLPRAARVRTVSEKVAAELRRRYPKASVSVLPIYVDVQEYAQIEKKSHPRFKTTLLWVGRFEEEKNPALALRALAAARQAGHDVGLVMLGRGSLDAVLGQLAEDLHVSEWVEFPGWQNPEKFLGVANLLLVTSKYEGYGRQIVEALAAGVPVLSTDVGIVREVGAIVTTEKDFNAALNSWFTNGPHTASLKDYPYMNFGDYVEKYCTDIEAAVQKH